MTRLLLVLGVLAMAVAGAASSASAKPGRHGHHRGHHHRHHRHAKVLKASLVPVSSDAAAYTNAGGRARLVVKRHRARVSIRVHGLVPNTRSQWAITTGGCTGPRVTNFTYRPLKIHKKGRGRAHGRSKHFSFSKTTTYSAVVYAANGTDPVLCGEFVRKKKKA